VKLAPIAFAIIAGLGAGSIASCSRGHCGSTGPGDTPRCIGWNQKACATISGCKWGTGCALRTGCGGLDQTTCQGKSYCAWAPNDVCTELSDPCLPLSADQCMSAAICMPAPGCVGTPVACETHDDEDACESDMNCDWYDTPQM